MVNRKKMMAQFNRFKAAIYIHAKLADFLVNLFATAVVLVISYCLNFFTKL